MNERSSRMQMIRFFAALALTFATSSYGASPAPGNEVKEPIELGTTNTLTGVVSSSCKPVSDAALAVFDSTNRTGGINGRRIHDVVLDDQYQAPQAVRNTRQFMRQDNILAVFGGCGTVAAGAIYGMLNSAEIPYLFPFAAAKDLVDPVKPWVFSALPLYGDQLATTVEYVMHSSSQKYGKGSVAGIFGEMPGVEDTIAKTEMAVRKSGGVWLGLQRAAIGTADYSPLALKLRSQNPDYVALATGAPDDAKILHALRAIGWMPKKGFLSIQTMIDTSFLQPTRGLANGIVVAVSPTMSSTSPQAAECVAILKSGGVPITGYSMYGCGTAQMLVVALKNIKGEITRDALKKELESWTDKNVSNVLPPITFSAKNHLADSHMIIMGVKNDEAHLIEIVRKNNSTDTDSK